MITRGYEMTTRGYEMTTRGYEMITRGYEMTTRGARVGKFARVNLSSLSRARVFREYGRKRELIPARLAGDGATFQFGQ